MLVPTAFIEKLKHASSVRELLDEKDDLAFLGRAYLTLLNRAADEKGLEFYYQQLRLGVTRRTVIAQIAMSKEGRSYNPSIPGLRALVGSYRVRRLLSIQDPRIQEAKEDSGRKVAGGVHSSGDLPSVIASPTGYDRVCMKASFISRDQYDTASAESRKSRSGSNFWFDLTTSLEWTGGVVGIIRAELEVACGLKKIYPDIRFVTLLGNGFVEIPHEELDWLLESDNVAESYLTYFGRHSSGQHKQGYVNLNIPNDGLLYHPFNENDTVIAMGWIGSEKEKYYAKIKGLIGNFFINYLVYDTILLNDETRRFYPDDGKERFYGYLKWVSQYADLILYGGKTAQADTEVIQKKNGWAVRPGLPIKFGTDIVKISRYEDENSVLESLGITGDFIITVGSLEPRKNHDTLYRAYLYALEKEGADIPQLVICGKVMWRVGNLVDAIDRDPRVKGKIIRLTPTDQELALLYKRCLFTVLPSLYEGWSLTLPESLGQGKFCIATETPPLKEIGGDLVEFVPGWDVRAWAEKIVYFSRNKIELQIREKRIVDGWPESTWLSAAKQIFDGVKDYVAHNQPRKLEPEIWIDLTTSYLHWRGGISGIIRAELTFARYIDSLSPNVHFFGYDNGSFFEIDKGYLLWLLNDLDLSDQYRMFQDYWSQQESAGTAYRNPFATGFYPGHPSILHDFPNEAIVLFLAIDSDGTGELSRVKRISEISKLKDKLFLAQVIYDFTPILFPHLHNEGTCRGYAPFVEFVYQNFDSLIFGGATAMRDGERLRERGKWNRPISNFIEFGSDVAKKRFDVDPLEDQAVLKRLGVGQKFIMTVGTIEPRKNHEMLYKAFLMLKERAGEELPKLIIVGKPGWKTEDFREILAADDRVADSIKILSPNDEELDVLYRHCQFTLLPSFYEGWSLTLPESLSYGKFCLVSDSEPLRETGGDLVEYINPLDTVAWADRIAHYLNNGDELHEKEKIIQQHWHAKSWRECSRELLEHLFAAYRTKYREDLKNG